MFSDDEIDHRFGFHKATVEGPEATLPRHSQLRRAYKAFAKELNEVLPDSRAKEVAFTELENASMWSHKAVAELAPAIEDAPVEQNNTEHKLRNLLENVLVEKWSEKTDRRSDESKQEFLTRMLRAKFIRQSDFDMVYGSAEEVPTARLELLNRLGHVRALYKLPDKSDLTFLRAMLDGQHITKTQFMAAFPELQLDE